MRFPGTFYRNFAPLPLIRRLRFAHSILYTLPEEAPVGFAHRANAFPRCPPRYACGNFDASFLRAFARLFPNLEQLTVEVENSQWTLATEEELPPLLALFPALRKFNLIWRYKVNGVLSFCGEIYSAPFTTTTDNA